MPKNKKSQASDICFTIKADVPTPLITVHFVSKDGEIEDKKKIPLDILLQHNYYVKKGSAI